MSLCCTARSLSASVLFFAGTANAQTFAPKPFTFVSGTPANASQVMANFQAFIDNGNAVSVDLANRIAAKQPFPAGAIAFFNLTACPTTWTLQSTYGTRFIRGLDLGRGQDPGNTLGQLESEQNQGHKHFVSASIGKTTAVLDPEKGKFDTGGSAFTGANKSGSSDHAVNSGAHGTEVRPHNVSLLICKKN